jgi:fumarate reductase subunit D
MEEQKIDNDDTSKHLFHLANKVIGLLYFIVFIVAIIIISLLIFYGVLLVHPTDESSKSAALLMPLIINFWEKISSYIGGFVSLVAPLFILLFALGILHKLGKAGASPFNSEKLLGDLPSLLALIIIVTICLLPLSGIAVPDVLSNIALVVVGFYFGKREIERGAS